MTQDGDGSRQWVESMTSLKNDLLEKMTSEFQKLESAIDRQMRRIDLLETSLVTRWRQVKYGSNACVSYGVHRHVKQKRDFSFELFVQEMSNLWTLQRQLGLPTRIYCSPREENDNQLSGEESRVLCDITRLQRETETYWMRVKAAEISFEDQYKKYEHKTEDCLFYKTFWYPKKYPRCEKMDFGQAEVSMGGGSKKTFDEATLQYIEENFEPNGVFRVPPFWLYKDRITISRNKSKNDLWLYSDEELWNLKDILRKEQIENLITERYADRAVEEVVNALERWAEQNKENMFIFTNYKYSNYLKKVGNVKVTNIEGDHDIMAISQRYGILFFQVKSCEPGENYLNVQQKASGALKQTLKDRFVFLQSNRDLSYIGLTFPVYGFVALPNVEDCHLLDKSNFCCYHRDVTLTRSSLETIDVFSQWLRNALRVVHSLRSPALTHGQFRELCGRYVGLASSVSVPTLSMGIEKTGHKLSLNILTPKQMSVKNSKSKLMIISGDTGTGKSLILAAKARLIMEEAERYGRLCKVNIVTCTDINDSLFCALKMSYRSSQQLEKFLAHQKDDVKVTQFRVLHENDVGQNFKVTPEILLRTIQKLTDDRYGVTSHILMDEVPYELLKQSKDLLDDNIENIPVDSHVWLTVCTHTYRVDSRGSKDPRWIKEDMPSKFDFEYLDLVKRVPRSLFNVVKAIQAFTGDGHSDYSKCGHLIDGPKPMLYRLDKCRCSTNAELAADEFMSCKCVQSRVYETFQQIFEGVIKDELTEKITIALHNFAINGTSFTDLKRLLDITFSKLEIPLIWSTVLFKSPKGNEKLSDDEKQRDLLASGGSHNYEDQSDDAACSPPSDRPGNSADESGGKPQRTPITVVDTRTFVGCESKILISFDQCGMFHHFEGKRGVGWHRNMFVRCVAQYIYVTWPEQEAAQNWRKYLKEYGEDVFARDNLTEEQLDFRKDQISQGTEASYKESCLERLLANDLFVVKS